MYPRINLEKTGARLKFLLKNAGYDVKYIQEYLHLSCPQSIYRWFKGIILPSVDHLLALSVLLGVHMEELLVSDVEIPCYEIEIFSANSCINRLMSYAKHLKNVA